VAVVGCGAFYKMLSASAMFSLPVIIAAKMPN
jgi:hypothetical protein